MNEACVKLPSLNGTPASFRLTLPSAEILHRESFGCLQQNGWCVGKRQFLEASVQWESLPEFISVSVCFRETEANSSMKTGRCQEKPFSKRTLGNHAGFSKSAPWTGTTAQVPHPLLAVEPGAWNHTDFREGSLPDQQIFNTFLLKERRGGEHKLCFYVPFPFHFYLNKNVAPSRNSWKSRNLLLIFYFIILCLSSQSYMVPKDNMKTMIEIQSGSAEGVPSYPFISDTINSWQGLKIQAIPRLRAFP